MKQIRLVDSHEKGKVGCGIRTLDLLVTKNHENTTTTASPMAIVFCLR